jgi:hypothetical protein
MAVASAVPPCFDRQFWPMWAGAVALLVSAFQAESSLRKRVRKTVLRMLEEGKNRGMLGPKEVVIDPVEICAAGADRATTARWPAVERIVTAEEALYVYISAVEAIIVPRRAFASPSEFDAFAEAARRHQSEAAARAK